MVFTAALFTFGVLGVNIEPFDVYINGRLEITTIKPRPLGLPLNLAMLIMMLLSARASLAYAGYVSLSLGKPLLARQALRYSWLVPILLLPPLLMQSVGTILVSRGTRAVFKALDSVFSMGYAGLFLLIVLSVLPILISIVGLVMQWNLLDRVRKAMREVERVGLSA